MRLRESIEGEPAAQDLDVSPSHAVDDGDIQLPDVAIPSRIVTELVRSSIRAVLCNIDTTAIAISTFIYDFFSYRCNTETFNFQFSCKSNGKLASADSNKRQKRRCITEIICFHLRLMKNRLYSKRLFDIAVSQQGS